MSEVTGRENSLPILLIEDEPSFSDAVVELLSVHHEVEVAHSLSTARKALADRRFAVVLIDKHLPDGNGLSLIPEIKSEHPDTVVLVLTGDRAFGEVRRAMMAGADDYVVKSGSIVPELLVRIPATVSRTARERHLRHLEEWVRQEFRYEIVGRSAVVLSLRENILRLRGTTSTVLIQGESGTGKELVARSLSAQEGRRKLVAANCGAIPSNLVESELFGHKRGSFTDAKSDRIGKFELAEEGDLFLDEIGELPLADQAKLLRVLQEREYTPVGDIRVRPVRCRVIAATNQNLEELVRKKLFREDLYHRLAVHVLRVPALRERKEDLEDLTECFLIQLHAQEFRLSPKALAHISRYDWPGNVRELRNALERGVIAARYAKRTTMEIEDLGLLQVADTVQAAALRLSERLPESARDVNDETFREFMDEAEREYLTRALGLFDGKATTLGEALGLARSTIFHKLGTLGITGGRPGLKTQAYPARPTSSQARRRDL